MLTFSQTIAVRSGDPQSAVEFLAKITRLSKRRVKDAMLKGAVWHQKQGAKKRRIRRATAALSPGDTLSIYYNEKLLALDPEPAEIISDRRHYSIWFKPPGLLTQGTEYGDHCSLLRQVQRYFQSPREVFAVHRLDREASGLTVVAHSKPAAAGLSARFRNQHIVKRYRVRVLGNLSDYDLQGQIDGELDDKPALTSYRMREYDPDSNTSTVDVVLHTGRKHQIRRHFNQIGYPVMGDPRYGKGNKNTDGMKLVASALEFKCPWEKKRVVFKLPASKDYLKDERPISNSP
ncbi:MAG: RluA family pseudouridine synthase [Deltaproteobacteria bacterium]|jgi:tRNA pseudouridine32 synthase/23S rRNA pseudouridine746 synthase|nr:RluA family pseudouridine synthase [Deltaproteobacteria bacterium]